MKGGNTDNHFMALAMKEAQKAEKKGEVPVGAVITLGGKVIARGHNSKETLFDPSAHAEVAAIRKAAKKIKNWRLSRATLYVTLEPCLMCMGAVVHARIEKLVFASSDPKAGACGSLYDISKDKRLNHAVKVETGVMDKEASVMLKNFFLKLRKKQGVTS